MNKQLNVWRVRAGSLTRFYFTEHHAEQMARALRLHKPLEGMPVTVEPYKLPDDALTRLTVTP